VSWGVCALFWVSGVLAGWLAFEVRASYLRRRYRALPPATAREVRRDRRRRADITLALARPGAERSYDERHWLPPSIDEFDHEETK
jgi:hypothetical protein